MRTPRLPVVEWADAPADLNGLVRLGERRNLVSARVPLHFKRSLPHFPHYLTKSTIFEWGGEITEHKMCVLIFSTTFVWNISHSGKNQSQLYHKCTQVFAGRYSSQILIKLEFSGQIFEKYSYIKFHKNPPSGSWVVSCGRTDRCDDANSRCWQCC